MGPNRESDDEVTDETDLNYPLDAPLQTAHRFQICFSVCATRSYSNSCVDPLCFHRQHKTASFTSHFPSLLHILQASTPIRRRVVFQLTAVPLSSAHLQSGPSLLQRRRHTDKPRLPSWCGSFKCYRTRDPKKTLAKFRRHCHFFSPRVTAPVAGFVPMQPSSFPQHATVFVFVIKAEVTKHAAAPPIKLLSSSVAFGFSESDEETLQR